MIKVMTNEKAKDGVIDFPKLMISKNNGIIILATKKMGFSVSGIILLSKNEWDPVGLVCDNWDPGAFSDYIGEITLKNELT